MAGTEVDRTWRPGTGRCTYHTRTRSLGARYIACPDFTSNAAYQASRLRTVRARYLDGECPSTIMSWRSNGSRMTPRHAGAKARNRRCPPRMARATRARLPSGGPEQRVVRRRQPRQVGDVLAQRQLPVEVDVGERPVGVVLRRELRPGGLEVGAVLLGPPVGERAARVELRPLIVEAVADL